jgi:FlaA1/EpsC-like NDP-sugar epimerase
MLMQFKYLRNRYFLLTDLFLLPAAVYLSYVLRLDTFDPASRWWPGMLWLAGCVIPITLFVFFRAGIYVRYWQYASIDEMVLLAGSLTIASFVTTGLVAVTGVIVSDGMLIPRSIPFIFLLLGLVATAGPRVLSRMAAHAIPRTATPALETRLAVIMGAGDVGAIIARELQQHPELGLRAVGFLDDNVEKHGMWIHGLCVLGNRHDIPRIVREQGVEQVIIAMPVASGTEIRKVVEICERCGAQTRIVPGFNEMLNGKVSVNQVRSLEIEDLLRRAPIRTDIAGVRNLISGKRVLITGAGGSIGRELARQALQGHPAELILLGHGENSIFDIHQELQRRKNEAERQGEKLDTVLRPVIADIRFAERMRAIFEELRPQIVFHAAAHKHVPLMESHPMEAISNNVIGTRSLLRAAQAAGVERLVMISSDKAVNPTSIMGASKRVAELLVHQAAMQSGRPYVAVRFGNVLGSRGSVVETFRRQIATGGPVTVTHPEMSRYFITIPEAVQLVLQASVLGHGGEVFVLDMGEPVKIVDLATDLIRLSGLEVGRDVEIAFSGLRPGEKLFEELFVRGEDYTRTRHGQIFMANNAGGLVPRNLDLAVDMLYSAAQREDMPAMISGLCHLVPEFTPVGMSVAGQGQQEIQPAEKTPLAWSMTPAASFPGAD